ncbi:MAG: hypothetical protein J6B31_06675 [Bacteroidaceae bacterium]|nr:hypothetical protein [Bacteroidaceae bacterium]
MKGSSSKPNFYPFQAFITLYLTFGEKRLHTYTIVILSAYQAIGVPIRCKQFPVEMRLASSGNGASFDVPRSKSRRPTRLQAFFFTP